MWHTFSLHGFSPICFYFYFPSQVFLLSVNPEFQVLMSLNPVVLQLQVNKHTPTHHKYCNVGHITLIKKVFQIAESLVFETMPLKVCVFSFVFPIALAVQEEKR